MFCQKCGAALPNDSRFCTECGTVVVTAAPQSAPTYAPAAPAYVPPAPKLPTVSSDHPVVAAIKKLGRSPLFLIATIFFTLMQLYSIVQVVGGLTGSSDVYTLIQALRRIGLPTYAASEIAEAFASVSSVTNWFSLLFGILTMSGLWAIYGASVSKRPVAGTAGLSIVFVTRLISLILTCLALLIALIIMVAAVGFTGRGGMAGVAMLIVVGVLAAVMAYIIVFDIRIYVSISRAKESLRTGVPNHKISGFVAVMLFIGSGFGMLSIAISLFQTMRYLPYMPVATLISLGMSLISNVVALLFGILIFMYKSKMKKFLYPAVPKPVYVAPVAVPVAPVAPVVETPVVSVVEIPVDVAPTVEEPVEEIPAEQTAPVEEAPAEEIPVKETPAEETTAEEAVPAEPVSEEQ